MAEVSENELQEVLDIVTAFYKKHVKSDEEVNVLLQKLSSMVQDQGTKLVHFGGTVFLTMVRDKGLIEFHPMYAEYDQDSLARELDQFVDYAKSIGVKTIFTYTKPKDEYEDVIQAASPMFDMFEKDGKRIFIVGV
jgi:putative NADH-flavin reductase